VKANATDIIDAKEVHGYSRGGVGDNVTPSQGCLIFLLLALTNTLK